MEYSTGDRPDENTPQSPAPPQMSSWRKLTQGKELSRLLYPNPVCFLCTGDDRSKPNVMVLSWLTATNNEGRFLFSINKHRYSATNLRQTSEKEFVLSVPVHGMEPLLRQVGSVSGACGTKFPANVNPKQENEQDHVPQARKKKRPHFPQGIPGLRALSLNEIDDNYSTTTKLFGIEGCVAFIACQIDQILENVIDEDHWLVVAEMKVAWVHPDYWCLKRNRFLPVSEQIPSYLTFLGSRTFGEIVAKNEKDE